MIEFKAYFTIYSTSLILVAFGAGLAISHWEYGLGSCIVGTSLATFGYVKYREIDKKLGKLIKGDASIT